jgi:hypothetical protein
MKLIKCLVLTLVTHPCCPYNNYQNCTDESIAKESDLAQLETDAATRSSISEPVSTLVDTQHGFRLLFRAPAVTLISILITAIGVGAATVVYAAEKAVLIEPFPYSHPEALVQIRTDFGRGGNSRQDWASRDDMDDVARENHSFTAIGTYHYALFNLGGHTGSLPEALYGLYVSASVFPTLGVSPMLGRNILPEETQPGRDHEMILSYGLWVRRFRADPAVVGRIVQVNGHDCVIIGVLPAEFDFPMRLATHGQHALRPHGFLGTPGDRPNPNAPRRHGIRRDRAAAPGHIAVSGAAGSRSDSGSPRSYVPAH